MNNLPYNLLQGCTYYEYLKTDGQNGDAELYERIYFSLLKYKADITVDKSENTHVRFYKILQLVLLDHPMIYYVNLKKTRAKTEEHVTRMKLSYVYNQKQCEAINEVLLHRVVRILDEAEENCGKDKLQLVKWLYTYLVQNTSYAKNELESEEDEVQCRIHSILGVFLDKKAVCDGMARALKIFLDELDIDNWIVRRDLEEGAKYTHEWNMILQEKNVFHLDATWERNMYDVRKQLKFDYFLLTEGEMQDKRKGCIRGD